MIREYPEMPIHAVAVCVVYEERVLLVLRHNPPAAGEWGPPGGAHELGEETQETAHREVREETGLELGALELLDAGDVISRDDDGRVRYHYALTYYLAHPTGGKLAAADDAADVRWVSLDEAMAMGISGRMLQIMSLALRQAKERNALAAPASQSEGLS